MHGGFGSQSKILIVGTSGSGKSTLARKICAKTGLKDLELDAFHWKPDWKMAELEEFRTAVRKAMASSAGFVIHGNYGKIADLTWGSADTVIWLDYPRSLVMWRVLRRTIWRVVTKKRLWSGNVETFRKSFLEKDSVIAWAWNTYWRRKEQFSRMMQENPYRIARFVRLRTPVETRKFLEEI